MVEPRVQMHGPQDERSGLTAELNRRRSGAGVLGLNRKAGSAPGLFAGFHGQRLARHWRGMQRGNWVGLA